MFLSETLLLPNCDPDILIFLRQLIKDKVPNLNLLFNYFYYHITYMI